MTDTSPAADPGLPDIAHGLHLFVDGCYDPGSRNGGWAFVTYRDAAEIAVDFGGIENTANNAMEAMALLQALLWIGANAAGETTVIWSDSLYATRGCNSLRPIWRHNGWKKIDPNPKSRKRAISDVEIWQAIDRQLSQIPATTVAWCKGHAGITGNERADELANQGRLSVRRPTRGK